MNQAVLVLMWFRLASASYYFHEPSRVIVKPDPKTEHETFGFSLAYQNGTASLIAGAPHSNLIGKVFQCRLDNIFNEQTYCEDIEIDFDKHAPYYREYTPNLKFNLGASVAAAPDYFLTCAPLWTTNPVGISNTSYGTCFTYNGTVNRYKGLIERYKTAPETVESPYSVMYGGTGWKTLFDEINEMLLIAKVSLDGDILYVNSSNPLDEVTSLVATVYYDRGPEANRRYFHNYRNLGYSMTFGKFFPDKVDEACSETIYAVSTISSQTTEGSVHFLYANMSPGKKGKYVKKLKLLKLPREGEKRRMKVKITDKSIGSMFGAAMASADLNIDGLSDLLVGAPAQDDGDRGSEAGALHIYLGGDMRTINDGSRHRVIVSSAEGSRFGSAIAASDVDGDDYPEIFVTAPYESMGVGALYILSGREVIEVVVGDDRIRKTALSKLQKTQKIISNEFKTFGYSMQSIPDMTGNGCDELAVGAPGSNEVIVLRCIPAVNVTISTSLVGAQIVKEQDTNFTVNVCVGVKHLKGRNFTIELIVTNEIKGYRAFIEEDQRSFLLVVSEREENKCKDVLINLTDNESGEYRFSTKVEMDKNKITKSNKFNSSWAMISSQSSTEKVLEVSRHCTGKDCDPNLTVNIRWSVSNETYELGSSDTLLATLVVENRGNSSFEACMLVRVSGAPVTRLSCGNHHDGYKCYMPKPLRRNAMHELPIVFNMSQSSNLQRELRIQASLYDLCNHPNVKPFVWTRPFKVNTDQVILKSLGHNQTVTDVEIEDIKVKTIEDAHEYWIVNEGSVTWYNATVLIKIFKKPFIESYKTSLLCPPVLSADKYTHTLECGFDLKPHSSFKIIVTSDILKGKIMENLKEGKLESTSILILKLPSAFAVKDKQKRLVSVIKWKKEKTLGQNKPLIIFLAILGALIALALVIFILYKMAFFKRKEKTMLEALKQEHVRRQSVKRSMSVATQSEEGGLDMEVDDDCPFEIVDINDPILDHVSNVCDTRV